jgi:carbonic anhydrase
LNIIEAKSSKEIAHITELFREYEKWISDNDPTGIDLCFQDFDTEVANLPGDYASPRGRLYLAYVDDHPAGCVCLRPVKDNVCEMKRLYLRPEFGGQGFGKMLINLIIQSAKDIGYRAMQLDTLPYMKAAQALYRRHGFREISPYYDSPVEGTIYMELDLSQHRVIVDP